jgi:hypothetical protein
MPVLKVGNVPTTRWIFFPSDNFVAVRDCSISGGIDDYEIYIFSLSTGTWAQVKSALDSWSVPHGAGATTV